jgi:hypothetical protein
MLMHSIWGEGLLRPPNTPSVPKLLKVDLPRSVLFTNFDIIYVPVSVPLNFRCKNM